MNFLLTSVATFLLISCSPSSNIKTKTFWIDNPTDKEISISIDENTYTIPSNSGINADITEGKHTLTYNNQSVNFIAKRCDQDVVLNPTLSNYVFYHNVYFERNKEDKVSKEIDAIEKAYLYDFEFEDGVVEKVPFKLTNDLFIERYAYYWHFDVATPFSANISIQDGSTSLSTVIQSKLFREKEFLAYVGESLPKGFTFRVLETTNLNDLKPYLVVDTSVKYTCEASNELIEAVALRFDSLDVVSAEEFPNVYNRLARMRYDSDLFNASNENKCEVNKDELNFTKVMLAAGKSIDNLGAMSGFVVQ